jgi:alpha-D-xyloside xylohydrolase
VGGEHKKYLDSGQANFYAVAHVKGLYNNQCEAAPDKRVFILTRSGYAGALKSEIAKGLGMSICGVPYWCVDAGAFLPGEQPAVTERGGTKTPRRSDTPCSFAP